MAGCPAYRPATQWCGTPPFAERKVQPEVALAREAFSCVRTPTSRGQDTLLTLTERSLQKGHWRVAARRFMMMKLAGDGMPDRLRAACEPLLRRLPAREQAKITADARAWVALSGKAGPGRTRG